MARRSSSRQRRRQRGSYAVLFALLTPVIIGFVGLSVDLGHWWLVREQLQNAADAAALAGAKSLDGTAAGRVAAVNAANTYVAQHLASQSAITAIDGTPVTGKWEFEEEEGEFEAAESDVMANAIRVKVRSAAFPNYFAPVLSAAFGTSQFTATAIAVGAGPGEVPCATGLVIASCVLYSGAGGAFQCPGAVTFQNGSNQIGFTHPDGTSPVNGNNTAPYIIASLTPGSCNQPSSLAVEDIFMQNGNDISQATVNAINAATNNGANPVSVVLPVVDIGTCPVNYNQSAHIAGFVKMSIVGARWTGAAPPGVAAVCPTLGKKGICMLGDCGPVAGKSGSSVVGNQPHPEDVYLVR